MRLACVLVLSLGVAAIAPAQMLTVGNDYSFNPNSGDVNIGTPRTVIDLVRPATGTGAVSTVKVTWSQSGCAGAFKIKFFRRAANTLTMTAERGPFTSGDASVALTPPVPIRQGDLIGVTKLGNCGNASAWTLDSDGYVAYAADVTGSVQLGDGTRVNAMLALSGSGTASGWVVGCVPVVGSTAGGFGSQFRTSMQMHNHQVVEPSTIHGRLIFHRAGTAGSLDDPAVSFTLAPGRVASYPDVVAAIGQSGIGSLDIAVTAGDYWPLVVSRIYNDAGSAGTSGLTEEFVMDMAGFQPHLLRRGSIGFLVTPADMTKMRLNIGVRSWFSGATITAALIDSTGSVVRTVTKSYLPNWFEQVDAAAFMEGPVEANQSIKLTVTSGSAIIYGSTTDNTTNDPAMQIVFASYWVS